MSPATALRQLQQAQAGLKKARQVLRLARGDANATSHVLRAGWESLAKAHKLLGEIPVAAANEDVMTRQLAVERYATALLVRLRRLVRAGDTAAASDDDDVDFDDDLDS
ncbi:MAG: hypothetical protein U0835_07085 [Isosphaeraceae bacterium]